MLNIVKGDLIQLAKEGKFDVIGHGCNCFCKMKRGIAPQMAAAFNCHLFPFENIGFSGDINKLGTIDYDHVTTDNGTTLWVVNMYTQYHWQEPSRFRVPLNYDALTLCLTKMNHIFKGKHIGLPKIGCGLAGGHWEAVRDLILALLKDCKVTIVEL